ncbi:hypothetical protein CFC21_037310 [Triticum aestivum]|uniref:Uncharacterized protein n=3 Tax=Triticum TaxID=4564 RepID=A0A9R0VPW5_TRITD|nr:hypothetical protein CFC21_037310 [Triticum aestivum]VAH67052.1 unnamed protein product [Triticum turgidum subsp. durum]
MAGAVEQNRLLLVVEIRGLDHQYHFVEVDVKGLFYPDSGSFPNKSSARARVTATAMTTARACGGSLRSLPAPMARYRTSTDMPERIDFALVGTAVAGASSNGNTFTMSRSGALSAEPELQSLRGRTHLIPLGHRPYALNRFMHDLAEPACLETLPLPGTGRRRQEPWRALPDPPPGYRSLDLGWPRVTAYLAAGTRLWVSAQGMGTCTFDTVRCAWRKEGDWELPFQGRGLVVPELGGLCFGLCPKENCLCACDMQQSPPAVRYVWEETRPRCPPSGTPFGFYPEGATVIYLGNGKFCISWIIGFGHRAPLRPAILLTALQVLASAVGNKLRVVNHKVRFYQMPSQGNVAHALQPDF